MITKRNLVLLGAPGAGKGTLATILTEEAEIPHISTGDIFRREMKNGTELGKKAQEYVNSGQLVPDQLVADMVGARLAEDDCVNGFILDGFPRTLPQADLLAESLAKIDKSLDAVVLFDADEELLLKRLTARLTCRQCGLNFNKIFTPPKAEGVCDKCGGELYQRDDDSLETAKDRLKIYNEQTAPLIDYYTEKGLLKSIDSNQPKDVAYPELLSVLA